MQRIGTFQGTIKIRQSLGDETVIKDALGYAWHGEHGILEVVQDHGNRIRFFPVVNIREVVVIPAKRKTEGSPGDTKRDWYKCPGCGNWNLYYRKKTDDYRCSGCKGVFKREEVENEKT